MFSSLEPDDDDSTYKSNLARCKAMHVTLHPSFATYLLDFEHGFDGCHNHVVFSPLEALEVDLGHPHPDGAEVDPEVIVAVSLGRVLVVAPARLAGVDLPHPVPKKLPALL